MWFSLKEFKHVQAHVESRVFISSLWKISYNKVIENIYEMFLNMHNKYKNMSHFILGDLTTNNKHKTVNWLKLDISMFTDNEAEE